LISLIAPKIGINSQAINCKMLLYKICEFIDMSRTIVPLTGSLCAGIFLH